MDIRGAAAVLTNTRKWAAAARELQSLRARDDHQAQGQQAADAPADLATHFEHPANYAHAGAIVAIRESQGSVA
jgi:hypothetical protein